MDGVNKMHTMNATQLAQRWDTTPGRLANWRSLGVGPSYVKVGARVIYRTVDVLAYEERQLVPTFAGVQG